MAARYPTVVERVWAICEERGWHVTTQHDSVLRRHWCKVWCRNELVIAAPSGRSESEAWESLENKLRERLGHRRVPA